MQVTAEAFKTGQSSGDRQRQRFTSWNIKHRLHIELTDESSFKGIDRRLQKNLPIQVNGSTFAGQRRSCFWAPLFMTFHVNEPPKKMDSVWKNFSEWPNQKRG